MSSKLERIKSSNCEPLFSNFLSMCMSQECFETVSNRQNIDNRIGCRSASFSTMKPRLKNFIARITLHVLDTVLDVAKAGEKDNEGLVDEIRRLPEFSSSPLARLTHDLKAETVIAQVSEEVQRQCMGSSLLFVLVTSTSHCSHHNSFFFKLIIRSKLCLC
jgi:hypothetical protein